MERIVVFRGLLFHQPVRRIALALICILLPGVSSAQAVAAVLDAHGLAEGPVRRSQRAAEAALKSVSALKVGEGPAWKKGAPRKGCDDDGCAKEVVRATGAGLVVLLSLKGQGEKIVADVALWLEGGKLGTRRVEGGLDELETAFAPALSQLLPLWGRKGWGGLRLDALPGSVVKVDGQVAAWKAGDVLALPAGTHSVDVLHPDGRAVLSRVTVEEGSRARLETPPMPELTTSAPSGGVSALRATSYGLWMGGAALLAGSLIAGALGRGTGAGMNACTDTSRACPTIDEALEKNRQAQAYASTANVLLYSGLAFTVAGAGLFTIDLAVSK